MFSKNKKTKEEEDKKITFGPDFVVRNMPKPKFSSGQSFRRTDPEVSKINQSLSPIESKKSFKKIGLLIISGGLIVIIILVYLSYRFVIKPSAQRTSNVAETTLENNIIPTEQKNSSNTPAALTPEVIVASSSVVDLINNGSSTDYLVEEASSTSDFVLTPAPVLDSDGDGLKDDEEIVLGTNSNSTDSDGDTYEDLAELNNNYNPAGAGQLNNNVNLREYRSPVSGYKILYPKNWEQTAYDDGRTVVFKALDDSLIQISLQANDARQSIVGWYGSAFPSSLITYDKLKNFSNWEGISGDDGLNFYLTDEGRQYIYVISYILADDRRLAYPNIFQLMINSLRIENQTVD